MNLLKLIYPNRCMLCNTVIEPNKPVCRNCSILLRKPPHIQILPNGCVCISAFRYSGEWRKVMLAYKFENKRSNYYGYAIILKELINTFSERKAFDIYTSVPMKKHKNATRRYDQTLLIARQTAKLNKVKYKPLLKQIDDRPTQHHLNREKRFQNVKNIYNCCDTKSVAGKNILLFDDVVTTGATLSECSETLLKSGAKSVFCISVNW